MPRPVFAALVLAVLALAVPGTAIGAVPTCFGKPATHVMQRGEYYYAGTEGDDVVVGSAGVDYIDLSLWGGTDLACGHSGDDNLTVDGPGSKADGGAGKDSVTGSGGALARGGSGDDVTVYAQEPGGRAEGGSGNDEVQAYQGAVADGGSGNDTLYGGNAVALSGGSGRDYVRNQSGSPKIDCGTGNDVVIPNGATDVRHCEVSP